ncbi:MAG: hypothetical protein MZV65_28165 [Chromatiales bacterium]|nr:hypothetical protein [Chromatiales bacterium]
MALFAPEPIFSISIPTHDIPGTFYLFASLVALTAAFRHWEQHQSLLVTLALIIISGVMGGIADVQRGTGLFLYISIALVVLLYWATQINSVSRRQWVIMSLLLMLVPNLVGHWASTVIWSQYADIPKLEKATKYGTFAWIASHGPPVSSGEYEAYRMLKPYLLSQEVDELPSFAIDRVLSAYSDNPLGIVRHYVEKSSRLYNLGRQGGEYYGNLLPTRLVTDSYSSNALRQLFDSYTAIYAIGLSIVAAAALVFILIRPLDLAEAMLPIIFLSTASIVLILIGEIQSRYVSFARYILPIYIAIVTNLISKSKIQSGEILQAFHRLMAPSIILFVVVGAFLIWARFGYGDAEGRFVHSSRYANNPVISAVDRWEIKVDLDRDAKSVVVFNSSVMLHAQELYNLHFFVTGSLNSVSECYFEFELYWGDEHLVYQKIELKGFPAVVRFNNLQASKNKAQMQLAIKLLDDEATSGRCASVKIGHLQFSQL